MSLAAFAFANVAAGQTDAALITGSTHRKILVLGLIAECGATDTTITFNSKGSGAGTAITAQFQNPANGSTILPSSEVGWFKTISGESLTCTTGAGSITGIQLIYVFITSPGEN